MDIYVLTYHGDRKISALRAVRTVAGLTLKEAKEAIDNPQGFVVMLDAASAILDNYYNGPNGLLKTMLDWNVAIHDGLLPIDLRRYFPTTPL